MDHYDILLFLVMVLPPGAWLLGAQPASYRMHCSLNHLINPLGRATILPQGWGEGGLPPPNTHTTSILQDLHQKPPKSGERANPPKQRLKIRKLFWIAKIREKLKAYISPKKLTLIVTRQNHADTKFADLLSLKLQRLWK